ncbi:MAG TPA: response regulator [Conexibacter sp.]|jgi:CheY-like chemotaxis protein|nr:response regulator [Conexibacter sp.]
MGIATTSRTDSATILWVDDQIKAFGSHIADLTENGYDVIAVETAEEALTTLHRHGRFDAILVDLKMPGSDGIDLLEQLYAKVGDIKRTKVIVLSSFLYDPAVRRRLVDLNMNVALLEKTRAPEDRPAPSFAHRVRDVMQRDEVAPPTSDQFTGWDRTARSLDPFDISLEAYRESPMVVRLQLDRKAQAATSAVRAKLSDQGVVWSLFCGSSQKPLLTATDVSDIPPDDEVFGLASRTGHPPYEFYERGEFEELTGMDADPQRPPRDEDGCPGSPDYPFFKIGVAQSSDDGKYSLNLTRDFHFDSGLDITAFDLEAALQLGLDVEAGKSAKFVRYGEAELAFYTLSGNAYVERGTNGSLRVTISGRAYPDWTASPFSRRCETFGCSASKLCFRRHALLGRNLLIENALQLDLRRI